MSTTLPIAIRICSYLQSKKQTKAIRPQLTKLFKKHKKCTLLQSVLFYFSIKRFICTFHSQIDISLLKDILSLISKSSIITNNDFQNISFSTFPKEMIITICQYSDPYDIFFSFSLISRHFYCCTSDPNCFQMLECNDYVNHYCKLIPYWKTNRFSRVQTLDIYEEYLPNTVCYNFNWEHTINNLTIDVNRHNNSATLINNLPFFRNISYLHLLAMEFSNDNINNLLEKINPITLNRLHCYETAIPVSYLLKSKNLETLEMSWCAQESFINHWESTNRKQLNNKLCLPTDWKSLKSFIFESHIFDAFELMNGLSNIQMFDNAIFSEKLQITLIAFGQDSYSEYDSNEFEIDANFEPLFDRLIKHCKQTDLRIYYSAWIASEDELFTDLSIFKKWSNKIYTKQHKIKCFDAIWISIDLSRTVEDLKERNPVDCMCRLCELITIHILEPWVKIDGAKFKWMGISQVEVVFSLESHGDCALNAEEIDSMSSYFYWLLHEEHKIETFRFCDYGQKQFGLQYLPDND
eukprot:36147_1